MYKIFKFPKKIFSLSWVLVLLTGIIIFLGMLLPVQSVNPLKVTNTVVLNDQKEKYQLGKSLEILQDSTQKLTILDVSQPQQKFTPSDTDVPNMGFSKAAIWAKVKLKNQSTITSQWYLEGAPKNVDQVTLYIPQGNSWIKKEIGRSLPFSHRELGDRNLVFILPLAIGEEKTIYLRYTSNGTIAMNVILWQPITYYGNNMTEQLLLGGFYGISFSLVVINLVLILQVKNVSYLYYFLFLISLTSQYFIRDALAFQYLWPEFPQYNVPMVLICIGIAIVSCYSFFISFLPVRSYSYSLYKLMNWFRWTAVGYLLVSWYFPLRIRIIAIVFLAIIMSILMIYTSLYIWYKGFIPARFTILAWGNFLLGTAIWGITAFGLLPSNLFTQKFSYVGTIGLLLCLAIALGDHINLIKKERNQLALEQQKLALIVEHSSEFISISNLDGKAIFLNDTAKKMIGLSSESYDSEINILDYFDAENCHLFQSHILPTVMEKGSWQGELTLCNLQTGELIYSIASFVLIKDQQIRKTTFLAAIIRDISQLKQAENDILAALEKQQAISEMRARFISMASHEIRTPLAIIASSTGILQTFSDRLTPEKKEKHLDTIQETIKRMTQLLDDVLMINRAEAEKMEFKPEVGDIIAFCHHLQQEIESISTKHKIDLTVDLGVEITDNSLIMQFDQKLLRQIFTNLLTNAIKYSPDHNLVDFNLIKENNQVIFKITDHGIGIPEADKIKLFQSFHRASNVGNISGTGLGLSIVRKCVELHQGEISFNSQIGKGTTFIVSIPFLT